MSINIKDLIKLLKVKHDDEYLPVLVFRIYSPTEYIKLDLTLGIDYFENDDDVVSIVYTTLRDHDDSHSSFQHDQIMYDLSKGNIEEFKKLLNEFIAHIPSAHGLDEYFMLYKTDNITEMFKTSYQDMSTVDGFFHSLKYILRRTVYNFSDIKTITSIDRYDFCKDWNDQTIKTVNIDGLTGSRTVFISDKEARKTHEGRVKYIMNRIHRFSDAYEGETINE